MKYLNKDCNIYEKNIYGNPIFVNKNTNDINLFFYFIKEGNIIKSKNHLNSPIKNIKINKSFIKECRNNYYYKEDKSPVKLINTFKKRFFQKLLHSLNIIKINYTMFIFLMIYVLINNEILAKTINSNPKAIINNNNIKDKDYFGNKLILLKGEEKKNKLNNYINLKNNLEINNKFKKFQKNIISNKISTSEGNFNIKKKTKIKIISLIKKTKIARNLSTINIINVGKNIAKLFNNNSLIYKRIYYNFIKDEILKNLLIFFNAICGLKIFIFCLRNKIKKKLKKYMKIINKQLKKIYFYKWKKKYIKRKAKNTIFSQINIKFASKNNDKFSLTGKSLNKKIDINSKYNSENYPIYNSQKERKDINKYFLGIKNFHKKSMNKCCNKIVNCLNINKNAISKKICSFYSKSKFHFNDFKCKEIEHENNKKYEISLISNNINEKNINDKKALVGLINLGATCFMNASLQILNNINKFSDYLCSIDLDCNQYPISNGLKNIFINLRNPNNKSYKPLDFTNLIGKFNSKFSKNEPNDSRQLIQILLNSIHKELNNNKNKNYQENDYENNKKTWKEKLEYEKNNFLNENKSIIVDLFYGIEATETYCYNCKETYYEFNHFNILTLPLLQKYNNSITINNMLDDYSRDIQLTGNNKNYCLFCEGDYDAYCRNTFYEMPEILIIHPGRENKGLKFNIRIDFEENIKIKLSDNLKREISYNLLGIIYHLGGIGYNGHNIAICKIGENWYEFNDSNVSIIDINDLNGSGILLLIYQK